MSEIRYGCHCDLRDDEEPDECVIGTGEDWMCIFAKDYTRKEECPFWRKVEGGAE